MRVLVACDDEGLRRARVEALVRLEMESVTSCPLARVHLDARTANPDLILVDGIANGTEARQAIDRARQVVGRAIGALVLLPDGATWLRVPLPRDVRPAVVLPSASADDGALRKALDQLRVDAKVPVGSIAVYGITLDRRSREVRANDLRARLTAEEASLLIELMEHPAQIVRRDQLARALVGRPLSDPRTRAMVEEHAHKLRAKLEGVAVAEQMQAVRDVGFRLVERRGRPRPPR